MRQSTLSKFINETSQDFDDDELDITSNQQNGGNKADTNNGNGVYNNNSNNLNSNSSSNMKESPSY